MKKILLYDASGIDVQTVREICNLFETEFVYIGDKTLGLSFEEALKLNEDDLSEKKPFQHSFLLLQGFTKDEFLAFDTKLNEKDISSQLIKISLTEHNGSWILENLFKEAEKEDRLYKKIEILRNLLDECNRLDYSVSSLDERAVCQDQLLHAFILLYGGKINEEDVDNSIHLLEEQIKKIKISKGDL